MVSVKEFFGLTCSPFSKNIASDQLYRYGQLEELFSTVAATVEDSSMALITGRAGTGKTTAVRAFLDTLPLGHNKVIYLGKDQRASALLMRLASSLGLRVHWAWGKRMLQIGQRLESESLTRKLILVIDEAHAIEQSAFDDIRFLTNQDMDRVSPVAVLMLGQPWLRNILQKQGHEALYQRLRLRYALEGLSEQETGEYLRHHLKLAGCQKDVFKPAAIKQIFHASDGILREINNLAFECLMRAAAAGKQTVDEKLANFVISQRELS